MPRRTEFCSWVVCACVLVVASAFPSNATTTNFSDGDFSAGWQELTVLLDDPTVGGSGPGTSSSAINRRGGGGNGGAYLESSHFIVHGDTIYSIGMNTAAVYDPAAEGAIVSIDFEVDLVHPSLGSTAWQLFVQQDGTNFYSIPISGFAQNASWASFALEELTEADFDTNPLVGFGGETADGNSPDFSLSGSPLTFGYALGNTLPNPGAFNNLPGVDNWSVTIEAEAVPGDFDLDNDIDGSDFLEWQRNDGSAAGLAAWELNYGAATPLLAVAIPEPTAWVLMCVVSCGLGVCCRDFHS